MGAHGIILADTRPSSLDVTTQYRLSSHRLGPMEFHSVLPRYVGSCCLVVARENGPWLLRTSHSSVDHHCSRRCATVAGPRYGTVSVFARLLRTSFVRGPSSLPTLRNVRCTGPCLFSLLIAVCMPCSRRYLTRHLVITRGPDPFRVEATP